MDSLSALPFAARRILYVFIGPPEPEAAIAIRKSMRRADAPLLYLCAGRRPLGQNAADLAAAVEPGLVAVATPGGSDSADALGAMTALARPRVVRMASHPSLDPLWREEARRLEEAAGRLLLRMVHEHTHRLMTLRHGLLNLPSLLSRRVMPAPFPEPPPPVVVCGAGPSLLADAPRLAAFRRKAVVFSVGHAVPALLDAGVTPDLVVELDPAAHYTWEGKRAPPCPLAAMPNVSPAVAGRFPRAAWMAGDDSAFARFLEALRVPPPQAAAYNHTVAVTAVDLALRLGARRIGLLGCDHCVSESGATHAHKSVAGLDASAFEPLPGKDGGTVMASRELVALRSALLEFLAGVPPGSAELLNCCSRGAALPPARSTGLSDFLAPLDDVRNLAWDSDANRWDIGWTPAPSAPDGRQLPRLLEDTASALLAPASGAAGPPSGRADTLAAPLRDAIAVYLRESAMDSPVPDSEAKAESSAVLAVELASDLAGDLRMAAGARDGEPWPPPRLRLPLEWTAFRNSFDRLVRRRNPELADAFASGAFDGEADGDRFKIYATTQHLPGVGVRMSDGSWRPLGPPYFEMCDTALRRAEAWAAQVGFDPDRHALVLAAPCDWALAVEFAGLFPSAPMIVVEPWPALLARVRRLCHFAHLLPEDVTVAARHPALPSWRRVCHAALRRVRAGGRAPVLLLNPHAAFHPEAASLAEELAPLLA